MPGIGGSAGALGSSPQDRAVAGKRALRAIYRCSAKGTRSDLGVGHMSPKWYRESACMGPPFIELASLQEGSFCFS